MDQRDLARFQLWEGWHMALDTETINSGKEKSGFAYERGDIFTEGI